jgi:hypothetical protein
MRFTSRPEVHIIVRTMSGEAIAAVASALAAIVSAVVAVAALRSSNKLGDNQLKIGDSQLKMAQAQLTFQQRQTIVDLWPALTAICEVNAQTAPEVVRRTVNTLELVAICYEAQAVDRDVVLATFGDAFVATYEELQAHHTKMPAVRNLSGAELLRENKATIRTYEEIKRRITAQGRITS